MRKLTVEYQCGHTEEVTYCWDQPSLPCSKDLCLNCKRGIVNDEFRVHASDSPAMLRLVMRVAKRTGGKITRSSYGSIYVQSNSGVYRISRHPPGKHRQYWTVVRERQTRKGLWITRFVARRDSTSIPVRPSVMAQLGYGRQWGTLMLLEPRENVPNEKKPHQHHYHIVLAVDGKVLRCFSCERTGSLGGSQCQETKP